MFWSKKKNNPADNHDDNLGVKLVPPEDKVNSLTLRRSVLNWKDKYITQVDLHFKRELPILMNALDGELDKLSIIESTKGIRKISNEIIQPLINEWVSRESSLFLKEAQKELLSIHLLDEILMEWKKCIGSEYQGYRNHVYRMIHYCFALRDYDDDDRQKIIIAAAFHDIGIWIEDTVDYIPPSIPPAMGYLKNNNLEFWSTEIKLMISEHHKIREYTDNTYPLVEIFRKADLVDFSLGLFRFGIPNSFIKDVKAKFPNSNFHKSLLKRATKWFFRHPLNPAPMIKW